MNRHISRRARLGLPLLLIAVLVIVAVTIFRRHYVTKHNEFDEKSPGIAVPDAPDSEGDRQRPLRSQ